jgi:hypothetical protein
MAYRAKWGEPGTDHVPTNYQIQAQHQMYCTDAKENIVSVLVFPKTPDEWEAMGYSLRRKGDDGDYVVDFGNDAWCSTHLWARILNQMGFFHQYPIPRNETMIKTIKEAYEDFWNTFIIGDNEPEIDRYEDIKRAFHEPVGTIVADEKLESWILEYQAINTELGENGPLGIRKDQLKCIILNRAKLSDKAIDDDTRDKTAIMNRCGKKIASYGGAKKFLIKSYSQFISSLVYPMDKIYIENEELKVSKIKTMKQSEIENLIKNNKLYAVRGNTFISKETI